MEGGEQRGGNEVGVGGESDVQASGEGCASLDRERLQAQVVGAGTHEPQQPGRQVLIDRPDRPGGRRVAVEANEVHARIERRTIGGIIARGPPDPGLRGSLVLQQTMHADSALLLPLPISEVGMIALQQTNAGAERVVSDCEERPRGSEDREERARWSSFLLSPRTPASNFEKDGHSSFVCLFVCLLGRTSCSLDQCHPGD